MNLCQQCMNDSQCAKCVDGYYLNADGTQCYACMEGVKECTASAVISCFGGYYYDSQTYICRKCTDSNCKVCSAKGKCDICNTAYILNSDGTWCLACNIYACTSCPTQTTCQSCQVGYYLSSPSQCTKHNCS